MCIMVCEWILNDTLWELVFSFHFVGTEFRSPDCIAICFYLLSYLTNTRNISVKVKILPGIMVHAYNSSILRLRKEVSKLKASLGYIMSSGST